MCVVCVCVCVYVCVCVCMCVCACVCVCVYVLLREHNFSTLVHQCENIVCLHVLLKMAYYRHKLMKARADNTSPVPFIGNDKQLSKYYLKVR